MRVWRYQGVHRLAWVVAVLLVLSVAVFVMAIGFSRLQVERSPKGAGGEVALPPRAGYALWRLPFQESSSPGLGPPLARGPSPADQPSST